jgi:hemerythrin-like domain-containing protein
MNAIEWLKRQHSHACDLYASYRQCDDEDEKQALFDELADNLAAHAIVEERLFYPGVFSGKRLEHIIDEHRALKGELAELLALAPEDSDFDQRLEQLFDLIALHVEQEEREVLPLAAQQIGSEELERLGTQMEHLFDEVISRPLSEATSYFPGASLPLE